jgi:hypothetical protein
MVTFCAVFISMDLKRGGLSWFSFNPADDTNIEILSAEVGKAGFGIQK